MSIKKEKKEEYLTDEMLYSFYLSQGSVNGTSKTKPIMNPLVTKSPYRGSLLHNGGYNKAN